MCITIAFFARLWWWGFHYCTIPCYVLRTAKTTTRARHELDDRARTTGLTGYPAAQQRLTNLIRQLIVVVQVEGQLALKRSRVLGEQYCEVALGTDDPYR